MRDEIEALDRRTERRVQAIERRLDEMARRRRTIWLALAYVSALGALAAIAKCWL